MCGNHVWMGVMCRLESCVEGMPVWRIVTCGGDACVNPHELIYKT